MLKATTKMPKVIRLKEPAKLRITVKNSVDKPIIIARVPTMDNRSFQRLISVSSVSVHGTKVTYILYYEIRKIPHGYQSAKLTESFINGLVSMLVYETRKTIKTAFCTD